MSLEQEGERRNNSAQLTEFAVNLIGNSSNQSVGSNSNSTNTY